jgi:hypothetical protein
MPEHAENHKPAESIDVDALLKHLKNHHNQPEKADRDMQSMCSDESKKRREEGAFSKAMPFFN